MLVNEETVRLLLPELVLVFSATAILVGGAFYRNRTVWHLATLVALVVAGLLLAQQPSDREVLGPIVNDGLGRALRWLLIISGVFFTSLSWQSSSRELAPEQIGSILLAIVGAMLASSANDLIMLFLGLELVSIPTYMLLFVGRRDRDSAESSAKYFFLSIVSSGVLLYGMSFVYGLGGTTFLLGAGDTPGIREAMLDMGQLPTAPMASLAPFALLLVIAGLGFKMTVAPFHFYAPDVYQGTTALNAGLLATLPKIAASAGIVRVVVECLPTESSHGWQVLLILSILSMTLGNVCALWQKNLRRMLAYSSIAHSGYMLIGMTVAQAGAAMGGDDPSTFGGVSALVFYLTVYTLASVGSFAALAAMGTEQREASSIDDLAGAGRNYPLAAAAMAVFMFSLAGIPPLAGFWGKFALFSAAIDLATNTTGSAQRWLIILSVLGALNAVTAAAYYLRVIGVMYFQAAPSAARTRSQSGGALAATVACALLVIGVGVGPSLIMRAAEEAELDVREVLGPSPATVAVPAAEATLVAQD